MSLTTRSDMKSIDYFDNNRHCSERFFDLTCLLAQSQTMRNHRLDLSDERVAATTRGYRYPLSAWPVIISKKRITEFDTFIRSLPGLYHKAMLAMFGNDGEAFARYLNVPPLVHEMLLAYGFDSHQMLARHDLVFTDGVLKLIEVNAGSTIGGWQPGLVEPQYREIFQQFDETRDWNLAHRQAMDRLFGAMRDAIARLPTTEVTGNVVMYLAEESASTVDLMNSYRAAFMSTDKQSYPRGKLLFSTDFSDLKFGVDGSVWLAGDRVDAVMLTLPEGHELPKGLMMQLLAANAAQQIVMPDNPCLTLLGNKLLMALLHEPALAGHLTYEELAMIQRHIPFTAPLASRTVSFKGRTSTMRELLHLCQEDFVIKKAHSLQGRDVYVGRFIDRNTWADIVDLHMDESDWLVQEYCTADRVVAPASNGELIEYSFVWGVFDAGGTYGGAFVRGMPAGTDGSGVINSATGATEFAVFEEADHKNKIVL